MRMSNFLLLILGCLSQLYVRIGGLFMVSEMLLLFLLPALSLPEDSSTVKKQNWILFSFFLAWVIAIIGSDIYNQTSIQNFSKGIAMAIMIAVNYVFFYRVFNAYPDSILYFLIGVVFSGIIHLVLQTPSTYFFLYGIFPILAPLLLVFSYIFWDARPLIIVGLFFILSFAVLLIGHRSTAMMIFVDGLLLLLFSLGSVRKRIGKMRPLHYLAIACVVIFGAFIFKNIYYQFAERGLLPEQSLAKYEDQTSDADIPIIFQGRKEAVGAFLAIYDSPWIGHGSKADGYSYVEKMYEMLGQKAPIYRLLQEEAIPAHSFLLNAWVENGILGALFFVYIIWLLTRIFLNNFKDITDRKSVV